MNITKERSCDGKREFRNRKAAMRALKYAERMHDESALAAYKCMYGEHFHIGHKRKPKKEK